jgi:hypothetical protein
MLLKGTSDLSLILLAHVSESELPRSTSTSALSGAGVIRLFNKVGETVNKITYKMDESDSVSCLSAI